MRFGEKIKVLSHIQQRVSKRPAKQLLWYYLYRMMSQSCKNHQSGLDVACGPLVNYPWFTTSSYLGLDIDSNELKKAAIKYPGVPIKQRSIQEMTETGDFVLCVQAIGIHAEFPHHESVACVDKLISATQAEGTLIFNLGPYSVDYFDEAESHVRQSFRSVQRIDYGNFSGEYPARVSQILGLLMLFLPFIAGSHKLPQRLYFCQNKI